MDGGASQPRFVGRADELARLEAALDDASAGRPRVVILAGEAGIGKSRLLREVATAWRARGIPVLEGACLQLGSSGPPYAPVVGVLRSLGRAVEPGALPAVLGPGRAQLARLVPDLVERAADLPGETADATSQVRLFELVAGAVERLTRRGPVVVAIEDAHWADTSSRDLLDFLVRGFRDERLLLVLTLRTDALARDDPVRAWIAELMRLRPVERLELGPLATSEVAALLADILGHRPHPDYVDLVMDRASGNAFLTEELAAAGDRADAPMPAHLREILLGRLASVGPATAELLRAAAAEGRRIDDRLLAEALGIGTASVAGGLRDAVAHGILVAEPGGGELRFRHPLLRDAVEAELLPDERRRLHLAFAEALERRAAAGEADVPPEVLAFHWDAGGRPDRAAPEHLRAARAAARVYAWAEACRGYDRALELGERTPGVFEPDRLPAILEEAANTWGLQGGYDRAVALARRGVQLVDPVADPGLAVAIHQDLRWLLWEAGDIEAAATEVEEALRLTPAEPPSAERARALAHAAALALLAGDLVEALRLAEETVAMARAVGARGEEALALGIMGRAAAATGDWETGTARIREAMATARLLQSIDGVALGYTNLVAILDRAGRTDDALAAADEGFAEVERYGLTRTFGSPLLVGAARMRFHQGRWDDTDRLLARARELAPLPATELEACLLAARLAAARGRTDEAAAEIRRATQLEAGPRMVHSESAGRAGDELARAEPASLQARMEVAIEAGDRAAGRRIADAAEARPAGGPIPDPAFGWMAALGLRLEADAAGEARSARDDAALETCERRIRRIVDRFEAGLARLGGRLDRAGVADPRVPILAAQCRAEGDRAAGRSDPVAWAAIADGWARLGRPYPEAYSRSRQAEAALATGDRDAARAALRVAATLCGDLGARPLQASVEHLARLARIDLGGGPGREATPGLEGAPRVAAVGAQGEPGSTTTAALGLTPRELEVLRLLAEGWSNPAIADELGISPKTASVHVSNVLAKLGVPNRVEAAVAATRLGLVDSGRPTRTPP